MERDSISQQYRDMEAALYAGLKNAEQQRLLSTSGKRIKAGVIEAVRTALAETFNIPDRRTGQPVSKERATEVLTTLEQLNEGVTGYIELRESNVPTIRAFLEACTQAHHEPGKDAAYYQNIVVGFSRTGVMRFSAQSGRITIGGAEPETRATRAKSRAWLFERRSRQSAEE